MLAWPCTDWQEAPPDAAPPVDAHWTDPGIEVRHTFTHFHLRLGLRLARVSLDAEPERGEFLPRSGFRPSALPTVMRKVYDMLVKDGRLVEGLLTTKS
jgi:A/G-specific adenine glycosylase